MVGFLNFLRPKETIAESHFMNAGTTGTEIFSGRFNEELLQKLQGECGISQFDEMRRSDSQVKMLLSVVKNPILSASWMIEPVDESEEEIKIKDFMEHVLFNDISYPDNSKFKTWTMFLEEALSFVDFGHSVFEVVHKVVQDHPVWGNYLGLRDLAFRSQKTIEEWNLHPHNGALKNILQCVDGDLSVRVNIPGEFLLVFSLNKEGDNYEGISALRSIYGNWLRRDSYKKIQAMGIERAAIGVPIGKLPQGIQNNDPNFKRFQAMLSNYTSHQNAYFTLPDGYEIDNFTITHDIDGVNKAIMQENIEMSKAFMANFMELGLSGAGSFSLGSDLADIALSGFTHIANRIAEQVNYRVIRQLVDAKFGKRVVYPKMIVTGINNKAGKDLAETIKILVDGGLITPSDKLEKFVRKSYDLPEITEDELKERTPEEPEQSEEPEEPKEEPEEEPKEDKELSECSGHHVLIDNDISSEDKKKIQLAESVAQKGKARIDKESKALKTLMQAGLDIRANDMIASMEKKLKKASTKKERRTIITDASLKSANAYKNEIRKALAQVSANEVDVTLRELKLGNVKFDEELDKLLKQIPANQRDRIKQETDIIVVDQDTNLEKNIKFQALNEMETSDSVNDIIAQAQKGKTQYIEGAALVAGPINFVSSTINTTRNDIYQVPEILEEIETFIFTNRNPISPICRELTGRVFSKVEYATTQFLPPLHHACKSFIVAQTIGGKSNKPVNPIGLELTGTEKQVDAMLKSKTF